MFSLFRRTYQSLNLITLSAEALLRNYHLFKRLHPDKAICPVLKGNAYGHGLVPVARILDGEECAFFIVDSLYEAYGLKKAKIHTPILILGYNFPHNLRKGLPFQFTASDLSALKSLIELKLPFHLEVDTGMKRMGLHEEDLEEAATLIASAPHLFKGLFSHLMTADEVDSPWLDKQRENFKHALQFFKDRGLHPQWVHLSNSAGALKTEIPEENLVRLGISLYGVNPYTAEDPAYSKLEDLKLVAKVTSTLIAIHTLEPGEALSYGATFIADKKMRVGIIPFGYYEGLPRLLGNRGFVYVAGKRCPIVGRVNMNHTFIDVSEVEARLGDTVELPLAELAPLAETIPYEMFTRLSPTIRRLVVFSF
jgi:alanine racemase